ncbi:glycoside hydrolase family 38 N-terminal domain-containing protein [Microlunatus flavus]|uniref:Glycosyl hydrolases family 38 C-terminal domain-containing protein n=1 Tax=Microlunatus flavus TaxID=1036181 RepID=A0A1H9ADK1_9ACTN|nr:glycoside hydrolase family 38 C-terminal domain-containing protein [Microlunatus flavus]SEP74730.1 Glycosyl hydrolases family 38 C-terminal domain-containing protein [Microlunatus flavus]
MTSHALPEPPPVWDSSFASSERFLAPSPVWDASLQRRQLLEHAVDASARVERGVVGLIAEPLVAADGRGTVQSVRLQPLADGVAQVAAIDTGRTRVELDGTELAVGHERIGGGGVRLLVPEVSSPTPLRVTAQVGEETITLETVLRPPRHYEVHLVQHSHLDIGYTDRQHVVRAQHLSYLDDVLRLARETDDLDDDARFRWNEEALFSVTDYLANRPPRARDELLRRVAENRVSLSAMPFNLHTEICSTDELHELLRPALELKRRYGVEFRTAMQTDVPGHVVGLPDALSQLGVRFLSVAHNWAGRSYPDGQGQMALPRLFRWRGPEGGEVVVWRTDTPHGLAYMEGPMVGFHESYDVASQIFGAYLASLGTKPYPMPVGSIFGWLDGGADVNERPPFGGDVLHLRTHGRWSDNAGPSRAVSDIVEEWNARWLFPHLRVSTNEAFFDAAMERSGDELPTCTGDWNDWWAHGVGSAVAPVGLGRKAQNDLAAAQILGAAAHLLAPDEVAEPVVDPDEGYRQLALWDEHTWGASNSWEHEDHGSSSGEHQWYWKVARAYAAVDESDRALQLSTAALAGHLGRHPDALVSVYAVNPTGAARTDELEVFLPAGVVPLTQAVTLVDGRTGDALPHTERPEPAGSRGLGRYLRVRLDWVGAVGFVRVDVRSAEQGPDAAEDLADPTVLENEHLVARIDLRHGTLASLVDKRTGREVVDAGSAFGFNHYVYDRYATIGRSNHNSSKFADSGNMALISSREVAGPAAVVSATRDARGEQVVVRPEVGSARSLQVTYRLPAGVAHLEITNRLSKDSTWDKESAFFAFPFAHDGAPGVLEESAGGLTGPDVPQVPGGAEYMRAIRHFVSVQDGEAAAGWATAEVPLVELRTLALPYVPFGSTLRTEEPGTVFSWVHNNIWDTNFPVQQAFDTDLRYRVAVGTGDAPALASRTAESLVQPLRPVVAERADGAAPAEGSLLGLSDERVQLVGLRHDADGSVLVRLRSNALDGLTARLRVPEGTKAASAATYLGEPLEDLEVVDGSVEVTFLGSGVRAVRLTLG